MSDYSLRSTFMKAQALNYLYLSINKLISNSSIYVIVELEVEHRCQGSRVQLYSRFFLWFFWYCIGSALLHDASESFQELSFVSAKEEKLPTRHLSGRFEINSRRSAPNAHQ